MSVEAWPWAAQEETLAQREGALWPVAEEPAVSIHYDIQEGFKAAANEVVESSQPWPPPNWVDMPVPDASVPLFNDALETVPGVAHAGIAAVGDVLAEPGILDGALAWLSSLGMPGTGAAFVIALGIGVWKAMRWGGKKAIDKAGVEVSIPQKPPKPVAPVQPRRTIIGGDV